MNREWTVEDELRHENRRLVAEFERLRQEPHWQTVAEERAATIDTLEAEVERLRAALDEIRSEPWTAGGTKDAYTIAAEALA